MELDDEEDIVLPGSCISEDLFNNYDTITRLPKWSEAPYPKILVSYMILQTTELSKYLEAQDIFGHFDSLSYSDSQQIKQILEPDSYDTTEGTPCTSHAHVLTDADILSKVHLMLLPTILTKIWLDPGYFRFINNYFTSCLSSINCSFAFQKLIYWLKELRNWSSITVLLEKTEEKLSKFSLEYRITNESLELLKYSAQIHSSVEQLHLLILRLQKLQSSDLNYTSKSLEVIQKIMELRNTVTSHLSTMDKILVRQENSIERFRCRTKSIPINDSATHSDLEPKVLNSAKDNINLELEVPLEDLEEQSTFENEVTENVSNENVTLLQFEVFELNMEDHEDSALSSEKYSIYEDPIQKEIKILQAELLDNLRVPLLARRTDMEEREARAYSELYGKTMTSLKDDTTDFLFSSKSKTTDIAGSHQDAEPKSARFLLTEMKLNREEETFGDEMDDWDNTPVKSDFLASLQTALRKRGC